MSEPQAITITKLERTCTACPAQFEGQAENGAAIYIRYRWGELRVHVGPIVIGATDPDILTSAVNEAVSRDPIWSWESDDDMDGRMSDERLRSVLPDWITIAEGAIASPMTDADLDLND